MTIFDLPKPQDKLAILKRIALFSACTEDQLQLIAERSRLVEYKKGECIYRQGDLADAFYVIASGRLQVRSEANDQKHVHAVLHNGDTFGEISLLTGECHSATIEALNDTLVLQLEKQDFDDLINRVPSLVLYLSRVLSKRLRTQNQAASAEATIVAIYSAAKGVGRTVFGVALAAMLRRETKRPVLVIDFNAVEDEPHQLFDVPIQRRILPATVKRLWSSELVEQEILAHPLGFDFLSAGELTGGREGEMLIAPLVSELSKRYHYILMDLSVEVGPTVLKALTQADRIYLVTDSDSDNVVRTAALMRQVRESVNFRNEEIRVILNLLDSDSPRMSLDDVTNVLGRPASFVLPRIQIGDELTLESLTTLLNDQQSPYTNRVRRIARELGGVLVGLALGSGAALGLAHIGIIKVLERERIPIDIVAGSSIGALIGGLWAAGRSAAQLEELAMRFKSPWRMRQLFIFDFSLPVVTLIIGITAGVLMGWAHGFWGGLSFGFIVCVLLGIITGPLIGGPIQGSQLTAKLQADFENKTFEETWLPLKVVACNPMSREEVIFDSGSIADAVRASVSIPGIFKPVTHMGQICLDGGVVNPIPVSVLKRAGCSRVIAVNVFPTTVELTAHQEELQRRRLQWDAQLASRSFPMRMLARVRQELIRSCTPLVFDVIMRSMQSMEYQIAEVSCRDADITLRPTLPGSHWLEFFHPEQFIRRGEEEALRQLPRLKQLLGVTEPSALTTSTPAATIQP